MTRIASPEDRAAAARLTGMVRALEDAVRAVHSVTGRVDW